MSNRYYLSIQDRLAVYHHHEVPEAVSIYVKILENCIREQAAGRHSLLNRLRQRYPARFDSDCEHHSEVE